MHPDIASGPLLKQALIILASGATVIPLFHRFRISPVLGFMLVGMAVGPFGFGRLAAQFPALGAVTITEPGTLEPIGAWGISTLMFMIGL
ncbi:MAG: cation:proton antiporter, partial [Proteobacteria bacterium]|nr:cation:proton antiporter [Pseudomonadota bacterium]